MWRHIHSAQISSYMSLIIGVTCMTMTSVLYMISASGKLLKNISSPAVATSQFFIFAFSELPCPVGSLTASYKTVVAYEPRKALKARCCFSGLKCSQYVVVKLCESSRSIWC